MRRLFLFVLFLIVIFPSFISSALAESRDSKEIINVTEVPKSLGIDPFYIKYVDANGIPIVSSANVRDEALVAARTIIIQMLSKRDDIRMAMMAKACKIMIIGEKEEVCNLPEYADICNTKKNIEFWNKRARGFGGSPESDFSASCGEENVIGLPGDRYKGENILVHEFAHLIHSVGICSVDSRFNNKLQKLYETTKAKGLWNKTYAMENKDEYFAEAVQSFFNTNGYSEKPNGVHGPICTRARLKKYDPGIYKLLTHYFFDNRELTGSYIHSL